MNFSDAKQGWHKTKLNNKEMATIVDLIIGNPSVKQSENDPLCPGVLALSNSLKQKLRLTLEGSARQ